VSKRKRILTCVGIALGVLVALAALLH